jgi:hypothetical protein
MMLVSVSDPHVYAIRRSRSLIGDGSRFFWHRLNRTMARDDVVSASLRLIITFATRNRASEWGRWNLHEMSLSL